MRAVALGAPWGLDPCVVGDKLVLLAAIAKDKKRERRASKDEKRRIAMLPAEERKLHEKLLQRESVNDVEIDHTEEKKRRGEMPNVHRQAAGASFGPHWMIVGMIIG